jgi:hypothetical protein
MFGTWQGTIAENISYGSSTAMDVMLALMVDDNVPSRGHRTNIMKSNVGVVGIYTGPHKKYRTMTTLDYAGGISGETPKDCPAGNGSACNGGGGGDDGESLAEWTNAQPIPTKVTAGCNNTKKFAHKWKVVDGKTRGFAAHKCDSKRLRITYTWGIGTYENFVDEHTIPLDKGKCKLVKKNTKERCTFKFDDDEKLGI